MAGDVVLLRKPGFVAAESFWGKLQSVQDNWNLLSASNVIILKVVKQDWTSIYPSSFDVGDGDTRDCTCHLREIGTRIFFHRRYTYEMHLGGVPNPDFGLIPADTSVSVNVSII